MSKFRKSKGFTLLETMVVVAIVIILAGIGFVEYAKYHKKLVQLERDNTAKELFIAAQNHLSMAEGQGYLLRDEFGTAETDETSGDNTGVYWYVVGEDGTDPDSSESALNLMLPFGSIDETVRGGGTYVIRYQKYPASVLDVFYCEPDERWGCTFSSDKSEYSELLSSYTGDANKDKRREYSNGSANNAVIGYYGGTLADEDIAIGGTPLKAPDVKLYNGDTLYVTVTNPNASNTNAALNLIVEGKTSGAKVLIQLAGSSAALSGNVKTTTDGFEVVLDDITSSGKSFYYLFCDGNNDLIPGEDITIEAVAFSNKVYTNIATSATVTGNSLFESVTVDGDKKIAGISSFRHLENLCTRVSNLDNSSLGFSLGVNAAEQLGDLVWDGDSGSVDNVFTDQTYIYLSQDGKTAATEAGRLCPVSPAGALDYNGNGYAIQGASFKPNFKAYNRAGVFGTLLAGSKIYDLELIGISAESAAAYGYTGALVGYATDTEISGVLVRNDNTADDSDIVIKGTSHTGGLAGYMKNGSITASAASVYVCTASGNADGYDGYAGGLVGMINGTTISGCYAGGHTVNARFADENDGIGRYNVQSSNKCAGGLVGLATGNYRISYSYATTSCLAKLYAGGLIGEGSGGSVDTCYTASRLKSLTNASDGSVIKVGAVIGAYNKNTRPSFNETYYIVGMSDYVRDETIEGVIGAYGTDVQYDFLIEKDEDKADAITYDDTLVTKYKGLFSFQTVYMLSGEHGTDSKYYKKGITDIHVGDWQIPTLSSLPYTIYNEDTLHIRITPDTESNYITFSIKGVSSENAKIYLLKLDTDKGTVTVEAHGYVEKGKKAVTWETTASTLPVSYDTKTKKINVVLDDITQDGQHFYELFGKGNAPLTPGENIEVRVGKGKASWGEIQSVREETDNSLFGYESTSQARISYVRHLQNLDPSISAVTTSVTSAVLTKNITWKEVNYPQIYAANGATASAKIEKSFYGIYNPYLTSFDGGNFTLTGFIVNSAPAAICADGANNAALFRYVAGVAGGTDTKQTLRISNLMLKNFQVSADQNAAALAAQVSTSESSKNRAGALTINTVIVSGSNSLITSSAKNAGGLVGSVIYSGTTIKNSAASVIVKAPNGCSGGLVGRETGGTTLSISNCFVGGQTTEKEYNLDDCNITGKTAGGLLGSRNAGNLTITNSFSAASVYGTTTGGGIIGEVGQWSSSKGITLDTVYTVAPVKNVKITDTDNTTSSGAFIGKIHKDRVADIKLSGCYYLPEVYDGVTCTNGIYSVAVTGNGVTLSGTVQGVASADGATNAISGTSSTIAARTYPYDAQIIADEHEYPFKVWTTSSFDKTAKAGSRIYYGDWQPELVAATVTHSITFKYADPSDGNKIKDITDSDLATQQVHENEETSLVVPYVGSFPGYKISGWVIKDSNGNQLGTLTENSSGMLVIPSSYAKTDLTAIAQYEKNTTVCTVRFWYDETGANSVTASRQIGTTTEVKVNSHINAISLPVAPSISGYVFDGWYNKAGTLIDFTSTTATVSENIDAYAHYISEDYYTIKVDFVYRIKGESADQLYTVPGRKPIELQKLTGTEFNDTVVLPTYSGYGAPVACQRTSGVTTSTAEFTGTNNSSLHITSNGASNWVVIYEVDAGSSVIQTYQYKIIYKILNTSSKNNGVDYSDSEWFAYDRYDQVYTQPVDTLPRITLEDTIGLRYDGTTSTQFKGNPSGFTRKTKAADIQLVDTGDSVKIIYVEYERNKYTLSFSNTGSTTIDPVQLYHGQDLTQLVKSFVTPERKGYKFNGWTLYKKGTTEQVSTTGTVLMPMYNVEAKGNWIAGYSTYKVLFWYENADDDGYSFMGAVNGLEAQTGSTVYSSAWSSYGGYNSGSHTHTLSCYKGAIDTKFETSTETVKDGCYTKKVTHYYYNGKEVTITDASQDTDAYISTWTYTDSSGSGKCIYYAGDWYPYTGNVNSGSTATCELDFKWVDDDHFTYVNNSGYTDHETVASDGSTILNVYFKRNVYTLQFYIEGSSGKCGSSNYVNVATITAKYYANISECFPVKDSSGKEYNYQWQFYTTNNLYTTSYKFIEIDRMPSTTENNGVMQVKEYCSTSGSGSKHEFDYYIEVVDAEKNDAGVIKRTLGSETRYFKLYNATYNTLNEYSWSLTKDEDFYVIDGFERWAYYCGSSRSTEKTKLTKESSFNNPSFPSYAEFYYKRDTNKVTAYVDGEETSGSPVYVQYGAKLTAVKTLEDTIAANKPAGYEDYTFSGFYYDSACKESRVDYVNDTMPLDNIAVYGKWTPPTYTVTFYMDEEGIGTASRVFKNVTVTKYENLDLEMADEYGNLKAGYVPSSGVEGTTFDGWYYTDSEGEKAFLPSKTILSDMNVYAKWDKEDSTETEYRDITISYKKSTDDTELTDSVTMENCEVGKYVTLWPEDITDYYPQEAVINYFVTSDENQEVIFYYDRIDAWNYNVEYYIELESLTGVTLEGYTFTSGAVDYLVKTDSNLTAQIQNQSISFSLPEEYTNFKFDHYVYNGKTGYDTSLKINSALDTTVRYYLVPDISKNQLANRSFKYDGTSKAAEADENYEGLGFTATGVDSVSAKVTYIYSDAGGNVIESSNVKNAGVYNEDAYLIVTVNETGAGARNFLVWKNDSKLTMTISKRKVTLTSGSSSEEFKTDVVLTNSTVTESGDGFVTGEGVDIEFTSTAFRNTAGTSKNAFTYTFKEGTETTNYDITTVFGDLTVWWKYRINYYFTINSVDDAASPDETAYPLAGEAITQLISSKGKWAGEDREEKLASITETVTIPAGYEAFWFDPDDPDSFKLVGGCTGDYDEETGAISFGPNPDGGTALLNIYLVPAVKEIEFTVPALDGEGKLVFCDGESKKTVTVGGYKADLFYVFEYYNSANQKMTAESELKAGKYKVYAYAMLRVEELETEAESGNTGEGTQEGTGEGTQEGTGEGTQQSGTGEQTTPVYSWYLIKQCVDGTLKLNVTASD